MENALIIALPSSYFILHADQNAIQLKTTATMLRHSETKQQQIARVFWFLLILLIILSLHLFLLMVL